MLKQPVRRLGLLTLGTVLFSAIFAVGGISTPPVTSAAGILEIAELLAHPEQYDQIGRAHV